MHIASADAAGFDLDEQVLGADGRLRDVTHVKVAEVF
jgi:hypothetical protein